MAQPVLLNTNNNNEEVPAMMYRWTVGSLSIVCSALLFASTANGQQHSPLTWQGGNTRTPSLQSPSDNTSSPQLGSGSGTQAVPAVGNEQQVPVRKQPLGKLRTQHADRPNMQEIPPVWPQAQPTPMPQPVIPTPQPEQVHQQVSPPVPPAAAHVPGYLGANVRDFYRERFCMHALTIRGVEVETVLPGSPAAHAGLRPARELTAREKVVALTAGLLTLTPAAAAAPSLVRFSGGIPHGDIILAVNGRRVSTQDEFQAEIERVRPQDTVYFTVHRGETNVQVSVRLTDSPTAAYAAAQ